MTTLNNLVARSHVQACQEKLFNHREKTAETANMSGTTKGTALSTPSNPPKNLLLWAANVAG
ncbi:hypothetical protein F441_08195 [Phytophthora nicotianae CJ01A1]|uniref:Uncharacterized protein n=5 Tax=Phytophthora nicotianae TaxID=4792 RepID=V9DUN4_PHYNI|nr:hypothetical protein F443_22846 [Phytophthora nicotianae P1569]ETO58774.1 hypothetical protein F444_22841 [Phytophthora nicotianae P1976]ETP17397.1 hypothetical protein F441_08195 [Phytophthora nicotianae CJ01A1]